MSPLSTNRAEVRRALATALRAIRRRRRLSAAEVARAMPMALRSYQALENGEGPLGLDRLHRFAEVTDCDVVALVVAASLGAPDLAIHCADNKFMTHLALRALDVDEAAGEDLERLTASLALGPLDRAVAELTAAARREPPPGRPVVSEPRAVEGLLTTRQRECLEWAQAGKSSSDIGLILGLSRRTVDEHLGDALDRLGVRTRVQAVAAAIKLGLLRG